MPLATPAELDCQIAADPQPTGNSGCAVDVRLSSRKASQRLKAGFEGWLSGREGCLPRPVAIGIRLVVRFMG